MNCQFLRPFAVIIGIVALSVIPTALHAQYTTASLGGTVSDETGAVLPGAQVTVNNVETAFTEDTLTDDRGNYLFPRLPVGQYRLTVEIPGFRTYVQSGITLAVNQAATQNVTLQVGEIGVARTTP